MLQYFPLMKTIYLDNNATSPLLPEISEFIKLFADKQHSNPSSSHSAGQQWRREVDLARQDVAALIGVRPTEIFFTASGTESNNWILRGVCSEVDKKYHIVTSAVEHPSIESTCRYLSKKGHKISILAVNSEGQIDLNAIESSIGEKPDLVSIQWVNSETGVIQPVYEIAELCQVAKVPFHTDAVQALGKIQVNQDSFPGNYASFSAHKIHGLGGVGATYIESGSNLDTLISGGSQERGLRAGTENLLGILAFGLACKLRKERLEKVQAHCKKLKTTFLSVLKADHPEISINGSIENSVDNCLNIHIPGIEVGALLVRMDIKGIYFSQNSACHGQSISPSSVLKAMGLSSDEAWSSARFSFSELNTNEEIKESARLISHEIEKLKV
jgi:cysteine desulfurase